MFPGLFIGLGECKGGVLRARRKPWDGELGGSWLGWIMEGGEVECSHRVLVTEKS